MQPVPLLSPENSYQTQSPQDYVTILLRMMAMCLEMTRDYQDMVPACHLLSPILAQQ